MHFSLRHLLSGLPLPSLPADLLAILLCSLLIAFMIRVGVMDTPVERSAHTRPIPKGGGIGIITAFLLCLPTADLLQNHPILPLLPLIASVVLLALISWLDDIYSFAARYKLAAQCLAAILLTIGQGFSPLTALSFILLTIFLTNALNFIDGINGLASGTMALSALFLAAAGIQPTVFVLLGLCLLTFLPWNFPKAKIFMGDVGSQSAALILAWGAMQARPTSTIIILATLSGVIWDVLFTLARRTLAKERLSEAHRGHLYQLATRSGIPATRVTLIAWGFALWGALVCRALAPECTRPILTGLLILLPQLVWTGYVCTRAKARVQEKW